MMRRMIRWVGLTNGSGILSTSTRSASGRAVRVWSIAASRRRNLPVATRVRHRVGLPHQHNVIMTSPPAELQQITNPTRASKMGAMLVGMGVLHFAVPKPFDSIVPAELPGDARFYTLASGVA